MRAAATIAEPWRSVPLTDGEFGLFQRLINERAGIFLSPAKRALLGARLSKRLRQLGFDSFTAYHRYVTDTGATELQNLFDAICTNETRFFREGQQFDYFEQEIIPRWLADQGRPKGVSVWSAACSSGEEPFSIAMVLQARLGESGWPVRVLATDLSMRVLQRAAAAEWPLSQAAQIPQRYLKRYMLRGRRSMEGVMKAGPEIRSIVEFARLNLNDSVYPMTGRFDVIFCRNVLIYFDAQGKRRVVDRLVRHLQPGGYLFLGAAESATGWRSDLRSVRPSICRYEP
jgi:chemotaxis protein methyltransferase CheR